MRRASSRYLRYLERLGHQLRQLGDVRSNAPGFLTGGVSQPVAPLDTIEARSILARVSWLSMLFSICAVFVRPSDAVTVIIPSLT
jgi:hypothetical protein